MTSPCGWKRKRISWTIRKRLRLAHPPERRQQKSTTFRPKTSMFQEKHFSKREAERCTELIGIPFRNSFFTEGDFRSFDLQKTQTHGGNQGRILNANGDGGPEGRTWAMNAETHRVCQVTCQKPTRQSRGQTPPHANFDRPPTSLPLHH